MYAKIKEKQRLISVPKTTHCKIKQAASILGMTMAALLSSIAGDILEKAQKGERTENHE